IRGIYKPRDRHVHKGNCGHSLIIGGSPGKLGAPILTTKSCIRAGSGLVTTKLPASGQQPLLIHCPEAMLDHTKEEILSSCPELKGYSAIAIGPGLGMHSETSLLLKKLIRNANVPVVFDADALNIISQNKTWLAFLPEQSIFTPHPGEFGKFLDEKMVGYKRLIAAIEFSRKNNIILILKDSYTTVVSPSGNAFFNITGNSGMATAGSGDVLTGIVTGLLSQGYSALKASILAVHLHGMSGNIGLENESHESLLASDIIANIGHAFSRIQEF
ncbi:MAG: NAD(P)H-hydrate dehydratase, partial [Flavobacteriales bacterium]|nr:NAD(P)H-hydrate dehydratase [Flavobacteriales bacterium]